MVELWIHIALLVEHFMHGGLSLHSDSCGQGFNSQRFSPLLQLLEAHHSRYTAIPLTSLSPPSLHSHHLLSLITGLDVLLTVQLLFSFNFCFLFTWQHWGYERPPLGLMWRVMRMMMVSSEWDSNCHSPTCVQVQGMQRWEEDVAIDNFNNMEKVAN